ncbi:hypothetical protein SPRG_17864, partial [Saprolegnia parasitica CBS 223.65]
MVKGLLWFVGAILVAASSAKDEPSRMLRAATHTKGPTHLGYPINLDGPLDTESAPLVTTVIDEPSDDGSWDAPDDDDDGSKGDDDEPTNDDDEPTNDDDEPTDDDDEPTDDDDEPTDDNDEPTDEP